MNKDLLLKVADAIEKNPTRYSRWETLATNITNYGNPGIVLPHIGVSHEADVYDVNANVAGWVVLLTHPESRPNSIVVKRPTDINYVAKTILGITDLQADVLFSPNWMAEYDCDVPQVLRMIAIGGMTIAQTQFWNPLASMSVPDYVPCPGLIRGLYIFGDADIEEVPDVFAFKGYIMVGGVTMEQLGEKSVKELERLGWEFTSDEGGEWWEFHGVG